MTIQSKCRWIVLQLKNTNQIHFQSIYTCLIIVLVNRIVKISGKSRCLESNHTKIKKWKLQTRFYWVCSWKCNICHAPSTGLNGIQFSILNVLESLIPLIPKDQIKYNNTEMKSGRHFTAATQHLTPAFVKFFKLHTTWSDKKNDQTLNRV